MGSQQKMVENIDLELACRDDNRQAPFKKIMADPSNFIEANNLPTGISIKDLRSMRLDSLIQFFKHISQRETSHSIPNTFRFKAVPSSRKLGTLHPAKYRHNGDGDTDPPPVCRKRRKPASDSSNMAVLSPEISEIPCETLVLDA